MVRPSPGWKPVVIMYVFFSMVLWEVADWQNEVLVATGMSSGVVCVWKAVLSEGRLVHNNSSLHSNQ